MLCYFWRQKKFQKDKAEHEEKQKQLLAQRKKEEQDWTNTKEEFCSCELTKVSSENKMVGGITIGNNTNFLCRLRTFPWIFFYQVVTFIIDV